MSKLNSNISSELDEATKLATIRRDSDAEFGSACYIARQPPIAVLAERVVVPVQGGNLETLPEKSDVTHSEYNPH